MACFTSFLFSSIVATYLVAVLKYMRQIGLRLLSSSKTLKYKKTEDNRLNIYIESNDPVISILSTSDFSRLEFKNEVIKEFPQDAIDAVEV